MSRGQRNSAVRRAGNRCMMAFPMLQYGLTFSAPPSHQAFRALYSSFSEAVMYFCRMSFHCFCQSAAAQDCSPRNVIASYWHGPFCTGSWPPVPQPCQVLGLLPSPLGTRADLVSITPLLLARARTLHQKAMADPPHQSPWIIAKLNHDLRLGCAHPTRRSSTGRIRWRRRRRRGKRSRRKSSFA